MHINSPEEFGFSRLSKLWTFMLDFWLALLEAFKKFIVCLIIIYRVIIFSRELSFLAYAVAWPALSNQHVTYADSVQILTLLVSPLGISFVEALSKPKMKNELHDPDSSDLFYCSSLRSCPLTVSSGSGSSRFRSASPVLAMREKRVFTEEPKPNRITRKDGILYVNGVKKDVRFSSKNNECYYLQCNGSRGDIPKTNLYFPLTNEEEVVDMIEVVSVQGPVKVGLIDTINNESDDHQLYSTGNHRLTFDELARCARYRDGRDREILGAPPCLFPQLASAAAYVRAKLLRRHICKMQLIDDDSTPVVDGPGFKDNHGKDEMEFRERTLEFYFGKRRGEWPLIIFEGLI